MAKVSLQQTRDDASKKLAQAHKKLEQVQEEARGLEHGKNRAAYDTALAQITEVKNEIARLSNEHGETARAHALASGAKNFFPPA